MRIWIVKDGENLPIEPEGRKFRMGMLVDELVDRGHDVTWWATTFSHFRKTIFRDQDAEVPVCDNLRMRLLHCGMYQRNFSMARLRHHSLFGSKFLVQAADEKPPEVVVSNYPVIEAAVASVIYCRGRRNKIPLIMDVRDQWPDTYLEHFPGWFRPLARVMLFREFQKSRYVFRNCPNLVAMSEAMLEWALRRGRRSTSDGDRVFPIGYPELGADAEVADFSTEFPYLNEPGFNFIYVGSFGKTYRFESLIEAVRMVAEEGTPFRVILAGDGENYRGVRDRINLPNFHFTGWLDNARLQYLLRYCHVGVVPWASIEGAMPNKVFEYMSHGLALLSSIEGEFMELVREENIGLFYPIDDASRLADQLRRIRAETGLVDKFRKNSRTLFRVRFAEKVIYSRFADFVEEVAKVGVR